MGYRKLCLLLLLLSSYAVAQDSTDDKQTQTCLLASRFKAHKKYVYQYTTKSQNGVVGISDMSNGPKVSCQVEMEVPQPCEFVLHVRDCALSDETDRDPQDPSETDAFKAVMERNPLKFSVEEVSGVQLYPEPDESVNILNIKRGIISALLVPLLEDDQSRLMSTVHGKCLTKHLVKARMDTPTEVTLTRDLSRCDQFYGRELTNSPLALMQKLHSPLSKLITSAQSCSYQFDNKGKHITAALCTEKHSYLPFSYQDNGLSSIVTQELTLQSTKRINNRIFDVNPSLKKPLYFEDPDDKAPVQDKEAVLSTMQELLALAGTDQGQKRTSLFHKLVSSMRVLKNETLSQTVTEMFKKSGWLTMQALFQCGSSECTSGILQIIRSIDGVSLEVDALIYVLSLQGNPDEAHVRDMLNMAQYKQSKAIMYALANTVVKFHKSEVTPVITDVSKFMETLLDDCSGKVQDVVSEFPADPQEVYFLVMKVVGVMGRAMQDVNPNLISTIAACAKKPELSLSNQKAALQSFRLMDINDEIRNTLMEVYKAKQSPVEKRAAAYLILTKKPDLPLIKDIVNNLENERDDQFRSFVRSHLNNILNSEEPQMNLLKDYIKEAFKDGSLSNQIFHEMSLNYKANSPLGSIESNILFDGVDSLPKEMTLGSTLKLFEEDFDLFEVGIEGNGFEPTIDALIGDKGFFSKFITKLIFPPQETRKERQAPQDLLKDITEALRTLREKVEMSASPEATAYLRLLGKEIGYMKSTEMRKALETFSMYYHMFLSFNFASVSTPKALHALTSNTENEVFGHYIFMENSFSLPTASGFPLKYSLAGVLAPGAKGGLAPSAMNELSFKPSVGLEFITRMGVYIPEYVDAGIEMHTNMFHQSSLNAKITMKRNQFKIVLPAPTSNVQLVTVSNELISISSCQKTLVPSSAEKRSESTDCQPLFRGLNLCTVMQYPNATTRDQAPYLPLTGQSKFAVEIHPTGKVSEYSASFTDETLREGKKGRHRVDNLKLTLRAEGTDPTEATITLKYNRNKQTVSSELIIPDCDIEAGIKLAVTDSDVDGTKIRGINIDVTNKNIPQLSLVGRARLEKMRDSMLQLQVLMPYLNSDASVTANLRKDEDMHMNLETVIHLPDMFYEQKTSVKYDNDKFEVELKSDFNSEIQKMIPNLEEHHKQLQDLIDNVLDQKVPKTDMKLRHIVTKGIEAGNIWLEKLTEHVPYLANLQSKRSSSDLSLPPLPEKLFLQSDSLFRYQFNKDKIAISIPFPHGGKKSEELNIPKRLSVPEVDIPEIGLRIPANSYPLPTFTIPPSLDFTVPLLGLAEASTKINSNFYSWEGIISGGNTTVDVPSYTALYKAMAQSPFCLLSYKLEGSGIISGIPDTGLIYLLNNSFNHCLIDTSFSYGEALRVTDKMNARANYKFEAASPLGLQASLHSSSQAMSTLNSDDVTGDGTMDGFLKVGSLNTTISYTNSYQLRPLEQTGRGKSTFQFNAPFLRIDNTIEALYENNELKIVSKTNAQKDAIKHVAEFKYKDAKLTLKSNAVATAMDKTISNKAELGISGDMAIFRFETQAEDDKNRAYSLLRALLDSNGLEANSEGTLMFTTGRGLHKATVKISEYGLSTSGTNSIQCSPVTLENIFDGTIDSNGAIFSSTIKAMAEEGRGEMNVEGKITSSEASLHGNLKGHAYDASTTNNMNILLNRRALTFAGNSKGTMKQIKTENSHTLTLTLWTLKLRSKTNNIICEDVYYKHDAKVDMKPFVVGLDVKNDLRIYDFILNNEDHLKFEPQKADLSGMVSAALGDQHNLKQSYEVIYNDMAATMKSAMSGNIMDSQLSHKCEVEIAGLSLTSSCEGRVTSEHLRMDGNIRTMALPFSLSIDALLNSDGELHLNGKHTGQLYSRFLVKAEPLAFSLTQDCRISTVHKLPNGESSTDLDSKFENLLTPNDQSLAWKVKSNLNEHTYLKDLSVANDKEKMLLEFSDVLTSNIISRLKGSPPEMQEFRTSGFFRYDKNSDCRIIEIPFIQSFPAAFEQLKNTLVKALESLKQSIVNLDIDQQINDFRDNIDRIPSEVSDFMQKLDLENKVKQVKAKLDYLINEFGITMEDLELGVNRLREDVEKSLVVLFTTIKDFLSNLEVYIRDGHFADKTMSILSNIEHQVHSWDKKYEIQQTVIKILDAIEDIIKQIDLQKLRDRSATFLRELDAKYEILDTIKSKLSDLKQAIKKFDLGSFLQDLKDYFLSPDWASFVAQLKDQIPTTEIAKVMESMNDVIVNWIDEYEIPIKLNAVYAYLRDLFLKYNLDDTIKDIMDQSVILLKEFKISETIQSVVDAVKAIRFEQFRDLFMQCLYSVTNQLRDMDYRKIINGVNENISSMLKLMKEFDYDTFVDEINRKIAQVTGYVNKQIKAYEIVEKLEAVRDYFREIQSSIVTYLEELRNTKVADALKKLKNVIDSAFFNDVKLKVQDMLEDMRQRISDMDIRDELYKYLQRTSESYSNIVAFISVQFDRLMEKIRHIVEDNEVFTQVKEAVDGVLDRMRRAEIKMPSFTLPLTDLEVPAFKINLNKLQEISIPAQISIPEFTILNSYTIPAFTGDFEEIKSKLVEIIDNMQAFELQTPNLEEIFGDLKVIYFSDLPDFTFPEITLSEIKVPVITIPKLNLKDFDIMMLSIPEIKFPGFPSDICVPVFGKLHGDFHINFPHYTLVTTWIFENITSSIKNPQLTATLTSEAKSSFEPLEYTFHAYAKLEAPRLKKLLFTEKVKARNKAFIIDHEGLLTLTGPSIQVSTKIEAKATAPLYTADLINNMALTIGEGITAATDTTYNHNLDVPAIETLSQTSMKHDAVATIAPGKITVTSDTNGNGKWSIQDYSDEGTHKNSLKFDVSSSIAKLIFTEETDSKAFKSKKSLNAEAVTLSHMTVEARCETELPFVKKSVMALNGEAHIGDLKVALTASHDAEFTGSLAGSMSNWLEFRAYPFEIFLDVKNKKNSKIFFPLRLVGKVDFLHDYGIVINSEKQLAFCQALARFNQYKYTHDFKVENNQMSITLQALANGEANLDFLTVPLTIPEITLPHIEITIPEVRDFSLWENAGLKNLFTTPQQSFDMNLRLQYNKNPDTHSFDLHLEPFYSALSDNLNILQAQFEAGRDKVVALLKDSYNQAKSQYIKHRIDTSGIPPRIFRVPGYKIPVLNIEVSSFRAEMPAFSYFVPKEVSSPSFKIRALGFSVPSYTLVLPSLKFPVLHVPESLSDLKLPTFTLPVIQNNIVIPVMGNTTFDFSFKSPMITLSADGGLYNQSDIVARFVGSSVSVFDILNGKIDGTTSLTKKSGLKLATTVSLEHTNIEANHECAMSLTKRNMEASVTNDVKINLPFLNLEFNDELKGNTKTKPNLSSKTKLKYMFNIPMIASVGKGNLDSNCELEGLSSYLSFETFTQGKTDISIMDRYNFAGDLENVGSFYLNANGLRSTLKTVLNANTDKQEKEKRRAINIFLFNLNENLALEVSLRRVFAKFDHMSNNRVDFGYINTDGKYIGKGEVDFVPLSTLKTTLNIDVRQSGDFGTAEHIQNIDLDISSEKQSLTWSGKEQLFPVIHSWDLLLSNDESAVRMDFTESVENYLAFLKSVKIPIYQKTVWDVLKFDQVTNMDNLQFLNISSTIVYTKSMDGQEYALPFKLFENGITFTIPEFSIPVPDWLKSFPDKIKSIDKRFEDTDVPDHLILPPSVSVPAFEVPFTNLHMEPFTIDLKNFNVPKVITTKPFDIMLPGFPVISVPSYDINTEYLQQKMSVLAFKMPQHEITVSSFAFPKSLTLGEYTVDLNEITNHISNFELPSIVIPEQKIEIPEFDLIMPLSVFVPNFGGLSAKLKVSSPIYNISTTANLEKSNSNFVTSLNSVCTSTIIFLEYDLTAKTTIGIDKGMMNLNGKGSLIHKDLNMDLQHLLTQNLRMKRQTPAGDSMESLHTLNIDITSPTFIDANFRFASRKDGITASVSSPSSGFLGLNFLRRSPSHFHGKLFSRYLSSPDKDVDVLTLKATLKNSEKLALQTLWNWEFFHDVIEGVKEKIPAVTNAVIKFLNKYHNYHFGFDLNRGGTKIKNTMSNFIERAYHKVPVSLEAVHDAVQNICHDGKAFYTQFHDSLMSMDVNDTMDNLLHEMKKLGRHSEAKVQDLMDWVTQFLGDTKFPESEVSLLDVVQQVHNSVSRAFTSVLERLEHLFMMIEKSIRNTEFMLPGSNTVVKGGELMDELTTSFRLTMRKMFKWADKTAQDIFQVTVEKAKDFLTFLKDQNWDIAQLEEACKNILDFLKQQMEEATRFVSENKNLIRTQIEEAYAAFSMERVVNFVYDFISNLQLQLYAGLEMFAEQIRKASQSTSPYIKVGNKKLDVEVPLPFFWKSFSEWPTYVRH
ncbi:apolipoprotein B-100 [Gouania willdenowi]|uniref:apolipoprotein B-100 n=1 Tax=Gouania willdenowi TaxID=441366 RepID=UPI00105531D6|nr:apolipoprotein B-100 [Gouania willdenowi]